MPRNRKPCNNVNRKELLGRSQGHKVALNITLDQATFERVKVEVSLTDKSASWVIREILQQYFGTERT